MTAAPYQRKKVENDLHDDDIHGYVKISQSPIIILHKNKKVAEIWKK